MREEQTKTTTERLIFHVDVNSAFLSWESVRRIKEGLPDLRVSVKTRIGKNEPEEWDALLALYERYPISELIVHPRVQKEFYKGTVHRDAFDRALDQLGLLEEKSV